MPGPRVDPFHGDPDLPGSVERTLIGFMGCYAAVAALRTAGVFPEPPSDRYPLPWPPL